MQSTNECRSAGTTRCCQEVNFGSEKIDQKYMRTSPELALKALNARVTALGVRSLEREKIFTEDFYMRKLSKNTCALHLSSPLGERFLHEKIDQK